MKTLGLIFILIIEFFSINNCFGGNETFVDKQLTKYQSSLQYNKYYALAFTELMNHPDDFDLKLAIGDGLENLGFLDRACKIYEQLMDEYPEKTLILDKLKAAREQLTGINNKIEEKEIILRKSPNDINTLIELANIYINIGDFQKSLKKINEIEKRDKKNEILAVLRNVYKTKLSVPTETAIKYSTAAIEKYNKGEKKEAFTLIRKALELSVHTPAIYDNYSILLLREGNNKGALICLREAFTVNPGKSNAFNAGNMSLLQGKYNDAIEYYSYILDKTPDSPKVLYNMALSLKMVGDDDSANEFFNKAFNLDPELKESLGKRHDFFINGIRLNLKNDNKN